MTALLEVRDLTVQLPGHTAPLLRGVSLHVGAGEALGLVGESGSGKSMTTRALLRLLPARTKVGGSVLFDGEDVAAMNRSRLKAWRSGDVGMVFQDPRAHINPVRSIGDFLTEGLRGRYDDRATAERDVVAVLRDVGITDPESRMRRHPHELSGGLLQRIMIASVLVRRPRLLVADEPTTALDVTTQADVMAIIDEQRAERGLAMLFITHDLDLAAAVCDRTAVMYAGAIVEERASDRLQDDPAHPYSAGLMASRPVLGSHERLVAIPGRAVSGAEVGQGCSFAPRCPHAQELCTREAPRHLPVGAGDGDVSCHFPLTGAAHDLPTEVGAS